jgi:hypothetical protein
MPDKAANHGVGARMLDGACRLRIQRLADRDQDRKQRDVDALRRYGYGHRIVNRGRRCHRGVETAE